MEKKRDLLHASFAVKASMCVMGTGQLLQKQWIKGLLYLGCFVAFALYLVTMGITDIAGFFTLGTNKADPWLGTEGDDSIMMLLRGILAYILTAAFIGIHISNVRDAYESDCKLKKGISLPNFSKAVSVFLDKKFYIAALAIPVAGVMIFNILPIIFMILIAFTNYGGEIVPPELVDWIGLDNFKKIL